jgi:hypothetical protein
MIACGSAARIQSIAARMSWSVMLVQWQTIMGDPAGNNS